MGFNTVTRVYHDDTAQLKICTTVSKHVTQYVMDDLFCNFFAIELATVILLY